MSLRKRLALSMVAAALPLLAAFEWVRRDLGHRATVDGMVELALTYMANDGRAACERAPDRFGGPLRRPAGNAPGRRIAAPRSRGRRERAAISPRNTVIWAYDASFASANLHAPSLPAETRAQLDAGADVVDQRSPPDRPGIVVAMRTPWPDGPCAYVTLLRRAPPADDLRAASGATGVVLQAIGLAAVLMLATAFAAWPLVRRIRRLTAAVEQSARAGYTTAVPEQGRDELGALARAFNEAGGEIREQIESLENRATALRAFLSNTTHDVMQPLTVLQGHLGTIRRRVEAGEPPDRGLVTACQEEAHYVASLIHNLTAAARLESGVVPIRRDRIDLRDVVERAVARHRPMATSRGQSLETGLPASALVIDGDVTLLEQAIGNLVHNAVRHNTTGKHIAVVLERDGERFVLRVVDDGPGVDAAQMSRLAERRFRTEDARQRHPDGQGLGLAIAREIVHQHGFELSFRVPEGGGFEASIEGTCAAPEKTG